MEDLVAVIEDVQAKPTGHLTIKNCDLVFTSERLLVVNRGASSFVAGMLGQAAAGAGGAIVAAQARDEASRAQREADAGAGFDELLTQDEGNMAIPYAGVTGGTFKTGFFSTFWILAPLTIDHAGGRFFCNVPYGTVDAAKAALTAALPAVSIS